MVWGVECEGRKLTEITARLSAALANRYAIEEELGAGGMAAVYPAEDLKHERKPLWRVTENDHRHEPAIPRI